MPSKRVDFVNYQLKLYQEIFVLNPSFMRGFTADCKLDWKKVEFKRENQSLIPKCRGIYAFVIENNHSNVPPHGYVMYVGETGQDSKHNLQKRYGDYLREQQREKRPRIHYLLNNWVECLYFHYASVTDSNVNLKKLEESLNNAFFPPCSTKDFSAEIRRGKAAWK
jgi:hypothetical protein